MARKRKYLSAKKRKRHKHRLSANGNIKGDLIEELSAKAFGLLLRAGKILAFEKFPKNSLEDRAGWDFMVVLLDEQRVPVDVTTTNPKTINHHMRKLKQSTRLRLVLPVELTTPVEELARKVLEAMEQYEPKLPPLASET